MLWEGASPAASRGTAEPGSAPPPPPPPAVTPEEAEEVSESRLGGSRTLGASRASWERPWSAARSRGGASLGLQSVRRRRPSPPATSGLCEPQVTAGFISVNSGAPAGPECTRVPRPLRVPWPCGHGEGGGSQLWFMVLTPRSGPSGSAKACGFGLRKRGGPSQVGEWGVHWAGL